MTCYINATDRIGNTNTVQLTNIRAEEICDDTDKIATGILTKAAMTTMMITAILKLP